MTIATAKPAVRLRTPMLVLPGGFVQATTDLPLRDVGALIVLASWWWPEGRFPEGAELGGALGIRRSRAETLLPALLPFFEPGGFFGVMRGAALAKSARRARAGRKGAAALHGRKGAREGRGKLRT